MTKPKKPHDAHVQAWIGAWLDARTVEEGECRLWKGSMRMGVPQASVQGLRGTNVRRWLWQKTKGPIPDGFLVMPGCFHQRCLCHLKLATRAECNAEHAKRGVYRTPAVRAAKTAGVRAKAKRYSMEKARELRELRSAGMSLKSIAERTGMPYSSVTQICRGHNWAEAMNGASVFSWGGIAA
jgi:hypothetical protein